VKGEDLDVSVVVPLEDPRGDVVEHLHTWTHGQTFPRDRYQVVVSASGEHPDFERRVAELLVPQDSVVVAAGAPLFGLYDAGARAGRAPVLVLTEAHVRAEAGCLAAVADAFDSDPGLDAAMLEHRQHASAGISHLSKRWFARAFAAWDRAGWARFNTTGVAIRAKAYARAGGLDARLGLFAPSLMSARLHDEGARVGHLEEAVLTHELEEEMGYSLELGGDFARGECVARSEQDQEFCERYFGPGGLWGRRLAYRPEIARSMVAALVSASRRSRRDARWLGRELVARLPAGVAGTRPRWAWERTTARLHQIVAASAAAPVEARWRSYVAAQERTTRAIQLSEITRQNGVPAPATAALSPLSAERLDGVLVGGHGLEREQGRAFRWTEPVALLRLIPPANGAVLRIETGSLRGRPLDYLRGMYAAGLPLPAEMISGDEERLEARLSPEFARAAADTGIVVLSRPLVPSRTGSSDRRRLGMPVAGLELSAT
jgi:hypothetical protein